MKLRSRVYLISTTSIAVALVVGLAIYGANNSIITSLKRVNYGHEITEVANELNSELRGILYFRLSLDLAKWDKAHANMRSILSNPPSLTNEQNSLVKNISASSKSLAVLFPYLINIEPKSGTHINQKIQKYLVERLYVQMDNIVENSLRLDLFAQDDIDNAINKITSWIVALLFILATLMTLFSLRLGRHISKEVTQLTSGFKHVANGNLDARVEIYGNDEFSQLAIDFNLMTKQLKETTYTRDLLQFEADTLSKEFNYLAHHDPLTGLPNRLLFDILLLQSLNNAKQNNEGIAVVFLDLDRFKNINDCLGHPVGDELLKNLADRFKTTLRKMDTVARISGDEFIILIEKVDQTKAVENAIKKLITVFEEPFLLQGNKIRVTASIGISMYPKDGEDPTALIRNADFAMYTAKDEGRNSYKFYNHELTTTPFDQVILATALIGAMDRNEFYLEYQPQVNVEYGHVIGIEALLRWNHPELGQVSPTIFIPIAEANGLIHAIGAWVLNEACLQGKSWLNNGLNFGRIAVNIAGCQVMKTEFSKEVLNALKVTQLPAENLELEVTESSIMKNTEHVIQQLQLMRSKGIQLAIDDFGTGFSSLSYLKQLPVHRLKIDQSFIADISNNDNEMIITEAVIALGEALNLKVIAEGVENVEQLSFLKARGCPEAQGFLFSKPISANDMTNYLNTKLRKVI